MLLDVYLGGSYGFLDSETVEGEVDIGCDALTRRVGHDAFLSVVAFFRHISSLDEWDDGKSEVLGEGVVAAVMGRHCHDSSCAVACEHVFRHPDRVLLSCEGVDGI